MPLDATRQSPLQRTAPDLGALVADLNAQVDEGSPGAVIRLARQVAPGLPLVSSFGAESIVLLHLAAMIDRSFPVIFIDTGMLFAETLNYQRDVAGQLGLRNLRILRSARITAGDQRGDLHATDPDACCALRKTAPLDRALAGQSAWITGRKRYQSGTRANLAHFELDGARLRIKVNPLARWNAQDVAGYIDGHDLPRHPLVAGGFASIGCQPCTSPVRPDEAPRAGRWRGRDKEECGIHFANGQAIPTGSRA